MTSVNCGRASPGLGPPKPSDRCSMLGTPSASRARLKSTTEPSPADLCRTHCGTHFRRMTPCCTRNHRLSPRSCADTRRRLGTAIPTTDRALACHDTFRGNGGWQRKSAKSGKSGPSIVPSEWPHSASSPFPMAHIAHLDAARRCRPRRHLTKPVTNRRTGTKPITVMRTRPTAPNASPVWSGNRHSSSLSPKVNRRGS